MINLSLVCMMLVLFLGVCGMLGYVLSAYDRLREVNMKLCSEVSTLKGSNGAVLDAQQDEPAQRLVWLHDVDTSSIHLTDEERERLSDELR